MATKRTKFDKSQRQADRLEKKADASPEQKPKKGQARDFALRNQPRDARFSFLRNARSA